MAVLDNEFLRAAIRASFYEFLGTALLVFMGTGSAVSGVGVLATAVAFGASASLIAKHISWPSGAHLNPAVTLASIAMAKTHVGLAPFYLVSQFAGAICGAGFVKAVVPAALYDANLGGANFPAPGVGDFEAILAETIVTALFVAVAAGANPLPVPFGASADSAAFATGVALATSHILLIPITGCSVNPARSIGSAVLADSESVWDRQHVYVVGPLLGASIVSLASNLAFYASAYFSRSIHRQNSIAAESNV